MDDGTIEKCALWQSEVGDRVPVVEALHIWPVLLGLGRLRMRDFGVDNLLVAALGCIKPHLTIERLREDLVDVGLRTRNDGVMRIGSTSVLERGVSTKAARKSNR